MSESHFESQPNGFPRAEVISRAEVVLPADDLQATIDWFVERCGFVLIMITPADDPALAVLDGHGIRIRLDRTVHDGPTHLRLPAASRDGESVTGPNGTVVHWFDPDPPLHLPANDPLFVLSRHADADWGSGRASMQYRDLIPQRQGGRFIASHISIPDGGPVPDYVHHHRIRFQMIYCHAGWAELVYEDQGPPFRFQAGDCVLQPPHIRHQVLATSDRFEVVEIGCPAVHDTLADNELTLPTGTVDPDRDFDGQRFVHYRAADAVWTASRFVGFSWTDFGIADATGGLADVGLLTADPGASVDGYRHSDEFVFWFVRSGLASLHHGAGVDRLEARDSVVLAPGEDYRLTDVSEDFEFLEVRLP